MSTANDLSAKECFGNIDIYVFDQIQRGHIAPGMRVLDAGCGHGRNLVYLLRQGYEVLGLDPNPGAITAVRRLAQRLTPQLCDETLERNFRVEPLEETTFAAGCADVVLCNAVLHFSRDTAHFNAQLESAWRLVAPGGFFFARLGSRITLEDAVRPLGNGRYVQPGGGELFLVDTEQLLQATERLQGELMDPIKTTHVQGLRCMTTWVMRKAA